MSRVAILAYGASSALGDGEDALGIAKVGEPARCALGRDDELVHAGLKRPYAGRVADLGDPAAPRERGPRSTRDRATTLLVRTFASCTKELDRVAPSWREKRVGLILGTSSGGMRTFEEICDDRPFFPREGWFEGTYLGPVAALAQEVAVSFAASSLVMGACASGTLAIGLGRAWLREDRCDVVLAGGFDAISVFVASGFEGLRATSSSGSPRPFRVGRDGLTLGEGAAVLAMVRAEDEAFRGARVMGFVAGFGASCDAVHLTAPERSGGGLVRALRHAMADADVSAVDFVSAHATATEFNDAAEANALRAGLGANVGDERVRVHALKGAIGHTLGAAGALETLSAAWAMQRRVLPPTAGEGPLEPGFHLPERGEAHDLRSALKLSAAFGGANAALVVTRENDEPLATRSSTPGTRPVYLSAVVARTSPDDLARDLDAAALSEKTGYPLDRLARADELVRLTIAAVGHVDELLRSRGRPGVRGAGILVGHGLATVDTNTIHQARVRSAGAHRVEPRRFPYTTPNACAGEAAVAFGLVGPAFAVGGGPHGGLEALAVAASMVRTGVADRMVVVAVDSAGEGARHLAKDTRRGVVAFLIAHDPGDALIEDAAVRLDSPHVDRGDAETESKLLAGISAITAHEPLLPLAEPSPPRTTLDVRTPWGFSAHASLRWLARNQFGAPGADR